MKVVLEKKTRKNPNDAKKDIVDYLLNKDSIFCCERFQAYFKKFSGWDYSIGQFTIVDEITYEGHSSVTIKHCPFCGEKIKYQNIKKVKN